VDVRSIKEYASGHIPGSVNIPLDALASGVAKYNKEKPVLLRCASGMRSGMAKRSLDAAGYVRVINAGSWQTLQKRLGK